MTLTEGEATTLWTGPVEVPSTNPYRYFAPLVDAAEDFIHQSRTANERLRIGLPEFDAAMRGIARKELMLVQGFAHSGKTVFVTQILRNNPDAKVALFTPDESRVLVLAKLCSMTMGISAEEIEAKLLDADPDMERLVRAVATDHFPNLAVYDQVYDGGIMSRALDEARDWWGADADLCIFDYADLYDSDGDTKAKINAIKGWGKGEDQRMILCHQASRTGGADGQEMTLTSGGYSGEQQAIFLVGVRRKRDFWRGRIRELNEKIAVQGRTDKLDSQLDEALYEEAMHRNTITFNLVKNKRPPGRLVEDIDYDLDPDTGVVNKRELPKPLPRAARHAVTPYPEAEEWGEF